MARITRPLNRKFQILRPLNERIRRQMKLTAFRSTLRAVVVLSMLVGGIETFSSAQIAGTSPARIVGVWDVKVTVLDCSSGVPMFEFPALHKYELGGTAQAVTTANPAAQSAQVGVWSPAPKGQFQVAFKVFQFNGSGNNIGWTVVRNTVAVSEDGNQYAGSGQATVYDLNGNPLGASCPTFTGTRFK